MKLIGTGVNQFESFLDEVDAWYSADDWSKLVNEKLKKEKNDRNNSRERQRPRDNE